MVLQVVKDDLEQCIVFQHPDLLHITMSLTDSHSWLSGIILSVEECLLSLLIQPPPIIVPLVILNGFL